MTPKIHFETRSFIIAHRPVCKPIQEIQDALKKYGKHAVRSTIHKVLKEEDQRKMGIVKPPRKLPNRLLPSACIKRNVNKVAKWIHQEDPPTQTEMAGKLGVSRRSIGRILKDKLQVKQVKKTKMHGLTAKQAAQRLDRGKKFVEIRRKGSSPWTR